LYSLFLTKVAGDFPKRLPMRVSDNALLLSFGPDWSPRLTDLAGPSMMATLRRRLLSGTMAPAVHEALVEAGYLEGRLALNAREWACLLGWAIAILFGVSLFVSVWMDSGSDWLNP
jgi:hypothetical protein